MLPKIIQGGMGVAISDWKLAKSVSQLGQMGVVSGTGLSRMLICRLMEGDKDGNVRRALSHFPFQDAVQSILEKYFVAGGKPANEPFKPAPMYSLHPSIFLDQLTAAANFVEVWLAKEGHTGVVGINLLEKVQMPTMASLYGAMLAGVDYVLMGAGIPTQIAGILDKFAAHQAAQYRLDVIGAGKDDSYKMNFDPRVVFSNMIETIKINRPNFLPIISSVVLAQALIKRSEGVVNGFVIEGPTAGGHNASPRGTVKMNERGEPIYGEKDEVDLEKMKQFGLPFWLAGGYGHPDQVKKALDAGAAGVQVGTMFALCNESGMEPELKQTLVQKAVLGEADVFTDPNVSPTGFPFKVARLEGTMSDKEIYEERTRVCDMGFLRVAYKKENGAAGFRCSAEPVDNFISKGGQVEDTVGKSCLCNNLLATAGFPQIRKNGYVEKPILTIGDDLLNIARFVPRGGASYSAKDVINYLLSSIGLDASSQTATT